MGTGTSYRHTLAADMILEVTPVVWPDVRPGTGDPPQKFGSNQKSRRASLDCTALKAPLRQIQATSQDRSGDEHTASRAGEASAADLRVSRVAKLGHVMRARLTQIMAFLNLAPDIQEAILTLGPTESGRDLVTERQLRPVAAELDWGKQREMWADARKA